MKLTTEKLKKLIKEEIENLSEMLEDDPEGEKDRAEAGLISAVNFAKKAGLSSEEIVRIVKECCEK